MMGVIAIVCSCQRMELQGGKAGAAGTEIVFGATTSYQNDSQTRTIYSGELLGVGTNTFERIDWEDDDLITVEYNQAASAGTYIVTGVSENAEKSIAEVESTDLDTKLVWGADASHVFYAMYPSNKAGRNTLENGRVTGLVPATQTITYNSDKKKYLPDMDYGYLVAYADENQIVGDRVRLPFTPATTAFEFQLRRASTDGDVLKLTKVELISETSPLSGTFSFQITGGNDRGAVWDRTVGPGGTVLTGTGTKVTVNFPAGGVSIPASTATDCLDFTLFALPVDLTGLSICLTYSDGTRKSLALKDSASEYHTFEGCKKYIIKNNDVPAENWEYVIDNLSDVAKNYLGGVGALNSTFKSYRVKSGTGYKEKVGYKIQYLDGTVWNDGLPSWLTRSAGDLSGSTTGTNLQLTMAGQTNSVPRDANGVVLDAHTTELRGRSVRSNVDLSKYNVATGATLPAGNQHWTANCYVVQQPGSYLFPLVYGSVLDKQSVYTPSYRSIDAETGVYRSEDYGTGYIGYFRDHLDRYISSPNGESYVLPSIYRQNGGQTMTAALLWMDAPGLVTNVSITTGEQYGANVTGNANLDYDNRYLRFEVPQATICQGNAIVAVLVGGKIAWSWHIWVTDADLTVTKAAFNGYSYPTVNLGWCDGQVVEDYAGRSCRVRVVQEISGETREATVTQYFRLKSLRGNSPYYQNGRKDPIQPGIVYEIVDGTASGPVTTYETKDKPYYPATTAYAPQCVQGPVSIGTGIQHPNIFYFDPTETVTWKTDGFVNLWNSKCDGTQHEQFGTPIINTVYDPSPSGFHLPPPAAYQGFNESNFLWSEGAGTIPPGRTYTVNGLFFPAVGHRDVRTHDVFNLLSEPTSHYWAGMMSYSLYVRLYDVDVVDGNFIGRGLSVRPVKE